MLYTCKTSVCQELESLFAMVIFRGFFLQPLVFIT